MRKWLYWVFVVIGLWIAASPWVLNFQNVEYAFYSNLISGLAVALIALGGWLAEENWFKSSRTRSERSGSLQAA
jgi:hypothetical protein